MSKLLATLALLSLASFAEASQYGCTVLLCLANPASNGGPKGIAECVAPINQLFRDLSKGRAFPSCDLADGNDGSSYAKLIADPYDPCPNGLTPAVSGSSYVVQGQKRSTTAINGFLATPRDAYIIQSEEKISQSELDINPSRACVGKWIGTYSTINNEVPFPVNIYDKVIWQPMQSPRAIDIYVNNTFFQRIHW